MLPPGHLRLAPGVSVPASALEWSQSRSGGPGGQHVNRTESRAELRLPLIAIDGLSPRAQARLVALAGRWLTDAGELVLAGDETRSLRRNRELVMERLVALVVEAQAVPRPRRPTRPTWGSVQRRLGEKSRMSERKRQRRDGSGDG